MGDTHRPIHIVRTGRRLAATMLVNAVLPMRAVHMESGDIQIGVYPTIDCNGWYLEP